MELISSIHKEFMEINNSIGKRLREARESMGKTQSDFAEIAAQAGVPGATRQSQAKYEKGLAAPTAAYMAAIAAVGVDVRYLITGSRDYEPADVLTAEEETMLSYFRQAPAAVRKAALGALIGGGATGSGVHIRGNVGQSIEGGAVQSEFTIDMGKPKRR